MLKISKRRTVERMWEYFLQRRFNSKKKLTALVEHLIIVTVAEEAKKEIEQLTQRT